MRSVVRYSLKQVVFINVVFMLLIVAGVYSLFTTPVENMPPVDIGRVFITTVYYGASPEDVEKLVTKKIEEALEGLENVEYIQSRSMRNYSVVDVKFIDDTDYAALYDELRLRILNIKDDLPQEADEPSFIYIDTQVWMPVLVLNILGDIPNRSLKLLADELKAEILNVPGVRSVDLLGEYRREFHVSLDPARLRRFGVAFSQAVEAIRSANARIPTGRFREGKNEFMLDSGRVLSSQSEVLDVIVRRDGDGNFIRVRDLVSSAMMSHRDPDNISSANGLNTISMLVKKEDSGNAVTIAEEVKRLVREFEEKHMADGVSVAFTWDSTIEIHDSVKTLSGNMILGMLLITVILWLTLGFRNAMITAVGIPFSFLCALIIIKAAGMSINTISLFSFVLVSGIIVDDAVIILENIYRHMQMGKAAREAIIDGVGEVMLPVTSTALTTILAFIPMLIMTGSTGEFFSVIPKTVTFALTASLLEALFILPVHVFDWGPRKLPPSVHVGSEEDPFHHLRTGVFSPFWNIYRRILDILLANRIKTMLFLAGAFMVAVVILVLSITGLVPLIKVEFFPGSSFRYHVPVIMPRGTPIEETDRVVRDLSRFIMSFGKKQALAAAGIAGYYEDEDYALHHGHHYGQVVVTLPEEEEREFPENPENDLMKHLDFMRNRLNEYIEKHYGKNGIVPSIQVFAENTGPPKGKAVNIRVSGNTMEEARRATDAIMEYLRTDPEFSDLTDLDDNRAHMQKVIRYLPREEAVYEYGLAPDMVTAVVAGALHGTFAGTFREGDEEVDLLVKLARNGGDGNSSGTGLAGPADILDMPVVEHSTSPVYLRDVVEMKYATEPDIKTRYKGKPTITITSNIRAGSKLSSGRVQHLVSRFFEERATQFPGVTLSFGGEFESTSRAYMSLTFAFFIAILAIYLVLASQFRDYFQPMIIISSVAFAIIGVTYGMLLARQTFTVGSFLAVVGLAGIAVNDSLILIDFINVRRRAGAEMRSAVIEACAARMRPVLITTITTMLGLLPMAIGIPRKSIAWAPMATAFVTGLSTATILTLLIIPVEYELAEKLKCFLKRLIGKETRAELDESCEAVE